jgi:hypothetical protein
MIRNIAGRGLRDLVSSANQRQFDELLPITAALWVAIAAYTNNRNTGRINK